MGVSPYTVNPSKESAVVHLDFPVDRVPRACVQALARALHLQYQTDVYTSRLINARGVRVHRVVIADSSAMPAVLLRSVA